MISKKRIAYYRVSTMAQGVSGLGLEAHTGSGDIVEVKVLDIHISKSHIAAHFGGGP